MLPFYEGPRFFRVLPGWAAFVGVASDSDRGRTVGAEYECSVALDFEHGGWERVGVDPHREGPAEQ